MLSSGREESCISFYFSAFLIYILYIIGKNRGVHMIRGGGVGKGVGGGVVLVRDSFRGGDNIYYLGTVI